MSSLPPPYVIFLMGPTAAGKTALATTLAKYLPCDIISVDATMIYKGMDIGSAKPSVAIRAKYPHQLIDICPPDKPYSAALFRSDAHLAIKRILKQKKIPLLVGGSSFYFRALEYGLSKLPNSNVRVREKLKSELEAHGSHFLHDKLGRIDKVSAMRIHPNDCQRIMRALEVFYISCKTLSVLQKEKPVGALNYPIKKIILLPERKVLHARIEARFFSMLKKGLIDEVRSFYLQKNINPNLPSMRGVGYRQVWQYLANDMTKEEMIQKAIIATRQLCKRQITWLRREKAALTLTKPNVPLILDYLYSDK